MIELNLHGVVGEDFDASTVQAALKPGGSVKLLLNSGGGIATEGVAIHSLLAAHTGRVDVTIVGIAASAASLLAMAGDTIIMRNGALMMIHDPALLTIGNRAEHQKSAEILDRMSASYARIYAGRSGKPVADVRELMEAESWFDGPEAVAAGFATATTEKPADAYASFDYGKYARADAAFAGASETRRNWKRAAMAARDRRDQVIRN